VTFSVVIFSPARQIPGSFLISATIASSEVIFMSHPIILRSVVQIGTDSAVKLRTNRKTI
jgi:hypothetical protein